MRRARIGPFPLAALERPAALVFAVGMIVARVWALASPWALVLMVATMPLLVLLVPGRAEFGADGVLLRWLGARRFVSRREIERARVVARAVRVELTGGEEIIVPTTLRGPSAIEIATRIDALRRDGREDSPLERALVRNGEPARAWITRLRRAPSFRTPALARDMLWDVLEEPRAHPEARAAAAIALSSAWEMGELTRARAVRARAVSPLLRRTLEACEARDDRSLEQMFAG